jgi:hypothetical protein
MYDDISNSRKLLYMSLDGKAFSHDLPDIEHYKLKNLTQRLEYLKYLLSNIGLLDIKDYQLTVIERRLNRIDLSMENDCRDVPLKIYGTFVSLAIAASYYSPVVSDLIREKVYHILRQRRRVSKFVAWAVKEDWTPDKGVDVEIDRIINTTRSCLGKDIGHLEDIAAMFVANEDPLSFGNIDINSLCEQANR